MHLRETASGLDVLAPAKLNLFLEVLAKRDDGFHELESLLVPIAWYDTLSVAPDDSGAITLSIDPARGIAVDQPLPTGRDNLVVRAAELLRERAGIGSGARLHLIKRIPLAAGLAGGSSDAAATLAALDRLWKLDWPRDRLSAVAAELGSDVPFFLTGGAAIARGRGERLEPVAGCGPLHAVVVRPNEGLSTADVFRATKIAAAPQSIAPFIAALTSGRTAEAGRLMHNTLEAAASTLSRWIARLRDEFAHFDAWGHQMSGSGTSYFGLFRSARQARRVAVLLRSRGYGEVRAVEACC